MKVSELIKHLQGLDGNLEVYCYTEDEKFASPEAPFHLLDITDVSRQGAVFTRGPQHQLLVSWDNENGRQIVTLGATSDM